MANEFEHYRHTAASERAELTFEEKARQKMGEHLKDAELESPRFQAFADYADLQNGSEWLPKPNRIFNPDMIRETTRQRMNGWKGYKAEYQQVEDILSNYRKECRDVSSDPPTAQRKFAQFLTEIKNCEIGRKSQHSLKPPRK